MWHVVQARGFKEPTWILECFLYMYNLFPIYLERRVSSEGAWME
jgi:hypothetical protein